MKKNLRKTIKNKNTRGMALLFTLGILMMVLVVVMLYASKVKTEARLASIQLETQSAKILAQSLLPRVMLTLNKSPDAMDLHLYSSGNPDDLHFDWIWKLEAPGHFEFEPMPSQSANLGSKTVPFTKYLEEAGGPKYDENSMPTWQYIHDPDTGKYVVARFAFVTIPQTLRVNPNALASHAYCRALSEASRKQVGTDCNICKMRLGASPSELFYREDMLASITRDKIRHRANDPKRLLSVFNRQDYAYWVDTQSFVDACADDIDDDDRTSFVADSEKYLTVNTAYSLETFWSDTNGDGKEDDDERFHRFNLRRTDWTKVGVAKGEGGSAEPAGCDEHNYILAPPRQFEQKHLSEIKEATAKGDNNFPTGGIAWLNNWKDGGDWGDVAKTKKQIAANLLNFCSPASRVVVSDVHPKEWTKLGAKKPTYTGLKRTLYLNEVYFEVGMDASVEVVRSGQNADGTYNYDVTISYYMETQVLTELVDMYYNTLGMKNGTGTPDFSAYSVFVDGYCEMKYNSPSESGNDISYSTATEKITFGDLDFIRIEDASSATADSYKPKTGITRRGYYLYCNDPNKGGLTDFCKTITKKFTLKNRSTPITAEDIYGDIKLAEKPRVVINHVVVRRKKVTGGTDADTDSTFPATADLDGDYENVDISLLEFDSNVGSDMSQASSYSNNLFSGSTAKSITMRGNFQIDDPRQNLLKKDWQDAHTDQNKCYSAYLESVSTDGGTLDKDKIRHSLPFTYSIATSSGGGGGGRPGSSVRPGQGGASTETREPNGVNFDYNGKGDEHPGVYYTKTEHYNSPEQDYEIVEEPSWRLTRGKAKLNNITSSDHISTAFIRHGDPAYQTMGNLVREFGMMSPWELGAIHRGSKWQTLNISRSREYTSGEQNFVNDHGGNEYKYGDGPILDQIKMTNDIQVLGKIDLCEHSYDDVKNFTLGALFLDMPFSTNGNYPLQIIDKDGTGSTSYAINNESWQPITATDTEKYVQELYDAIYIGMGKTIRDPSDPPQDYEAKALFSKKLEENRFFRRSDILAFNPVSAKGHGVTWNPFQYLRRRTGSITDAIDEQIIGRTICLMSVESIKVKSVKALLVVQMLSDRGVATIRKDWDNDGKTGANLHLRADNYLQAQLQAGYRRFSDAAENGGIFATYDQLKENIRADEEGVFHPGVDAIVGEAKILATLVFDQKTQKWKIMRYEFVE